MHLGTKVGYLFFRSSRIIQATEIQFLHNQCEQERTQTLTILMLALENFRLAGYCSLGTDQCFWKPIEGSLALSLPEDSFTSSHDESML